MRHNKKFNHLGRKTAHRKAMLANMACSLIVHKRISTTVAKAKALRMYVEPLMTKSKIDSTHSRRIVFSYLQDKEAVSELFRDVALKIADRPGGFTRILKTGNRLGDNAEMCIIELVDYNEAMLAAKEEAAAPKNVVRVVVVLKKRKLVHRLLQKLLKMLSLLKKRKLLQLMLKQKTQRKSLKLTSQLKKRKKNKVFLNYIEKPAFYKSRLFHFY